MHIASSPFSLSFLSPRIRPGISMRLFPALSLLALPLVPVMVHAQPEGQPSPPHHALPDSGDHGENGDHAHHGAPDNHGHHADPAHHAMPNILSEPTGSGTGWLPSGANPHEHALHVTAGDWTLMTHGEAVLRYNTVNFNNRRRWATAPPRSGGQSDYPRLERGGRILDMPNWAMVSAERATPGGGQLLLRGMLSLDPVTIGRKGYPLLYQTGEGLTDRQHPHDLFMELGVLYSHPLGESQRLFAYAGLPGEPALGPVAFMHRGSIGGNPDAPLGHHFQDATHITHGVLTAGYIIHRTKLDGSLFRGREPDAERYGIDAGPLDSWSVRATQNLGTWSLQASYARIHAPEPDDHGDVQRTTVSVSRARTYRPADPVRHENTFVWGMNAGHHGTVAHSLLRESSLSGRRGQLWSRWEILQRGGGELDLVGNADVDRQYWVYALTIGAGGRVLTVAGTEFFLGAQGTANLHDGDLEPYYGRFPLSAQLFLKVRPAALFSKRTE